MFFPMFVSPHPLLKEKKEPFRSGVSGDYFVKGDFIKTVEYLGFCVIAGVITKDCFLQ
jgi:hypothetical protein